MKLFNCLPIPFIFVILTISCGTSQKQLTTAVSSLRPRIKEGDTLKYEIKFISNSRMYINTFEYPELQYYASAKIYTIVTKIEGDSISFKSALTKTSASLRKTGYQLNSIHTKNYFRMDFWKDLKGKEWEYTLTPTGLTKSSDEKTKRFIWFLFPFLPPKEPVSVGQSWEKEPEKGFIVNFRFNEMKGDNAIIEYKYNNKEKEEVDDSDIKEAVLDAKSKAKVILNTRTGKVTEIKIDSKIKKSGKIKAYNVTIYFDENWNIKAVE